MNRNRRIASKQAGYALIVVLSSLSILTILFASSFARTTAQIEFEQAEEKLASEIQNKAAIAAAALGDPRANTGDALQYETGGQVFNIEFQAAGGLIDINTASISLVEAFLEGLQLTEDDMRSPINALRNWRNSGKSFHHISEVPRVMGLPPDKVPEVELWMTVYSGRSGISVRQAPERLLRHLLQDQRSARANLERLLPVEFQSPPGGENYHILAVSAERRIPLGAIRFGSSQRDRTILQLN